MSELEQLRTENIELKGHVAELVMTVSSLTRQNEELMSRLRAGEVAPKLEPKQQSLLPAQPATAGPRFTALRDRLVAAFLEIRKAKYAFKGAKDAQAINRLLRLPVLEDEVVSRWKTFLRVDARAGDIAQFEQRFNATSGVMPSAAKAVDLPDRYVGGADTGDCALCGAKGVEVSADQGVALCYARGCGALWTREVSRREDAGEGEPWRGLPEWVKQQRAKQARDAR